MQEEEFDLVVLSVGMEISVETRELAARLDRQLREDVDDTSAEPDVPDEPENE